MMQKHDLLDNLNKIKTTELGVERIRRNLGLAEHDVISWCKEQIRNADYIARKGKNWYVHIEGAVITINASSYTIITAHKDKKSSKERFMEECIKEEEMFNLIGWDFSHLKGRWDTPETPWDYREIIQMYLKDSDILLDMGTGGGEFLLTLNHPYEKTAVTEAYLPNYELCKSKLAPLGIMVAQTFADDKLPFGNDYFDIIINRHESFDLSEVNRTLKPGGYFITQQVGSKELHELRVILNDEMPLQNPNHSVKSYAHSLEQLRFQIIVEDEVTFPSIFYDIGAVIFYAKACEWEVPNFSVETYFDKLWKVQQKINQKGYFQGSASRFVLVAQKIG